MLHTENVPAWVWLLLAAFAAVFLIIFAWRLRRRRIRDRIRKARHIRQTARTKTWRWLFGQPRMKRLSYQTPPDERHD